MVWTKRRDIKRLNFNDLQVSVALNEYIKFCTQHTNIEQVALYAEVGV